MKKFLTFLALVVTVLCCNAQAMYVASTKGNVNLRSAPSTTAAKVGQMTEADLLPYIDMVGDGENGWYKVDNNGKEAYVSVSVSTTVDAEIPDEMFGKSIDSDKPWDKIRHQGSIQISKIDDNHAIISMDWMRVNLPAESYYYLASLKDGKVVATHQILGYADKDTPMAEIMENADDLDKPIPVGFEEFNCSLIFEGLTFSMYD